MNLRYTSIFRNIHVPGTHKGVNQNYSQLFKDTRLTKHFISRYTAVCRPYSYNSRETTMRPSLRLVQILLPVLLISVVVNLPRYLDPSR